MALTKRFGALHSAITTTARKAVTLMLSFVYFRKAFTAQHLVGATVFMVGLMVSHGPCCRGGMHRLYTAVYFSRKSSFNFWISLAQSRFDVDVRSVSARTNSTILSGREGTKQSIIKAFIFSDVVRCISRARSPEIFPFSHVPVCVFVCPPCSFPAWFSFCFVCDVRQTKVLGKEGKSSSPAGQSANNSPAVTPMINSQHRKYLGGREESVQLNSRYVFRQRTTVVSDRGSFDSSLEGVNRMP